LFAILFLCEFQAAHSTRDTGGAPPNEAIASQFSFRIEIHVAGRLERRFFAKIDERRAAIRHADEHESTSADISGKGMRYRQSETDRDRGIYGVSAGFQDGDADIRCQRLLSDHHSFSGEDRFVRVRRRGDQAKAHNERNESKAASCFHGSGL
jgi:hypothetical protein